VARGLLYGPVGGVVMVTLFVLATILICLTGDCCVSHTARAAA
jgi:hypothetical protein